MSGKMRRVGWLTLGILVWISGRGIAEPEGRIVIETHFVEIDDSVGEESGLDWLLLTPMLTGPAANASTSKDVKPAKVLDDSAQLVASTYAFNDETATVTGEKSVPAKRGGVEIAGVFTNPQFKMVAEALAEKGVALKSAPTVRARSGQPAKVQIVRADIESLGLPEPVKKELGERAHGVELAIVPEVGPEGFTIDLTLLPELVRFEGFINYGSAQKENAVGGVPVADAVETQIVTPVFQTRKGKTNVTIWDGQTIALSGIVREDRVDVEKRVPLLGDLPLLGAVFRSTEEIHIKRRLLIFVTARLVKP